MYAEFYGLHEQPFELTPDLRYLFLSEKHREALTTLHYGIGAGKGLTLLLGEAGTGKTMVVRAAVDALATQDARIVHLNNPSLTRREFYEYIAETFQLGARSGSSKTRCLLQLSRQLGARMNNGGPSALVVDEAQSLTDELLEEVRLLANLEAGPAKLLQIVLVAQPSLGDRLNESAHQRLKQRVALRCVLEQLDLPETAAYVGARLRLAGGDAAAVFTRDAVTAVYEYSRGIPRAINVICDNALLSGFAAGERPVEHDTVLQACHDLDLRLMDGQPAAAPPPVEATALTTSTRLLMPASEKPMPTALMNIGVDEPEHAVESVGGLFEYVDSPWSANAGE